MKTKQNQIKETKQNQIKETKQNQIKETKHYKRTSQKHSQKHDTRISETEPESQQWHLVVNQCKEEKLENITGNDCLKRYVNKETGKHKW